MNFFSHKKSGSIVSEQPLKGVSSSTEKPIVVSPIIKETKFGEKLASRQRFKELGPPDMLHFSMYDKYHRCEFGYYHYVTGQDVSSPLAALGYITTVQLNNTSSTNKHPGVYTYCTYNIFSQCDMRIRTEYPAHNASYQVKVVPEQAVTDTLWEETAVSGIVRAYVTALDMERKVPGLVEVSLFNGVSSTQKIIDLLIKFLPKGHVTGCDSTVQRPTVYENNLVSCLLSIVEISQLYDYAIERLSKYPLLVVQILILQDREIDAVKMLSQTITSGKLDTVQLTFALNLQVEFLLMKNSPDLALPSAHKAVEISVTNFQSWYNMTRIYILQGKMDMALLSLNSCPMYPLPNKDFVESNGEVSLPQPLEGMIPYVWEDPTFVFGPNSANTINFLPPWEIKAANKELLRCNAIVRLPRGTSAKVYELLVLIVEKVGWEKLLSIRSQVFVMEEEYFRGNATSEKRMCERWLDSLFLMLYDDLKLVLASEAEMASGKSIKRSGLEWQLIGLTSLRTCHFNNAIAALRTATSAKFDIVATQTLLHLVNKLHDSTQLYKELRAVRELSIETILELLCWKISWERRFYNELQLDNLMILKKLARYYDKEFMKNIVISKFNDDKIASLLYSLVNILEDYE